jgi:hypothetical protein
VGMPAPNRLEEFMAELKEVAERRHLHLEVQDGHLVAVDDTPGIDPVLVHWDESLKSYSLTKS